MKLSIIMAIFLVLMSLTAQAKMLNYKKVRKLAEKVLKENNYSLTTDSILDIETFCPRYNTFDIGQKETFFAHLVAQMSLYESEFNTTSSFLETNGNISAGLLSISFGSLGPALRSAGCDVIKTSNDLKDAYKNLQCGFAIISHWTSLHHYLALDNTTGASIYWSTLRPPYAVEINIGTKLKPVFKTVTVGKKLLIIEDLKEQYSKCFKK